MCWSCNPYCGGCKPPKPKPRPCPACGTYNKAGTALCRQCGAELPPPEKILPVWCYYIGEICANPCNRSKEPAKDGKVKTCKWHTRTG